MFFIKINQMTFNVNHIISIQLDTAKEMITIITRDSAEEVLLYSSLRDAHDAYNCILSTIHRCGNCLNVSSPDFTTPEGVDYGVR